MNTQQIDNKLSPNPIEEAFLKSLFKNGLESFELDVEHLQNADFPIIWDNVVKPSEKGYIHYKGIDVDGSVNGVIRLSLVLPTDIFDLLNASHYCRLFHSDYCNLISHLQAELLKIIWDFLKKEYDSKLLLPILYQLLSLQVIDLIPFAYRESPYRIGRGETPEKKPK